jgi:predicted transglutaminase-like cysteine proteinase
VVQTQEGDLVLDNITSRIAPWFKTLYQWVRIQLPGVGKLWTTIVGGAA